MPKKSFILHVDSLCVLNEMSDEQAGKLIKAIYSYQIGEEFEMDAVTKMVFVSFKNQFIRDDDKYQQLVEKNRIKGLKSAESRSNKKQPQLTAVDHSQPTPTDSTDNDSKNDSDIIDISQNPQTPKKRKEEAAGGGEFLEEGKKFADWFDKNLKPQHIKTNSSVLRKWAAEYDKIRRIDGKTKDEIIAAVNYARTDEFWAKNFHTPMKMRSKNADGVMYIDVFIDRVREKKPVKTLNIREGYNPRAGTAQ